MKKRRNGEGSYGTRNIRGYSYYYYRSPDRKWTVYAKTSKELDEKIKQKQEAIKEQESPHREMTVADLCDEWLSVVRSGLAPSTYDAYEDIVNVRIKRYTADNIRNRPVGHLTVMMIESYLDSMTSKYSKASIDKTWVVLKQSLEYGSEKGYVSSKLDLSKVKKPKEINVVKKKKDIQFTTKEDIEILRQEAFRLSSRQTPIYGDGAKVLVFIMYSGLRLSEATGLTWDNVAADYTSITVRQSNPKVVKRDQDGHPIIENGHRVYENLKKSPKTESGYRTIPIPNKGQEILRYFNDRFPNHKRQDNVFLTSNGTIFHKRNLERILKRMLDNSQCSNKDYTPHSLRHGYGSILLSQGVDIKTVSILLGHKDISTTYNIYIHVLEEDKIKAIRNVFD